MLALKLRDSNVEDADHVTSMNPVLFDIDADLSNVVGAEPNEISICFIVSSHPKSCAPLLTWSPPAYWDLPLDTTHSVSAWLEHEGDFFGGLLLTQSAATELTFRRTPLGLEHQ